MSYSRVNDRIRELALERDGWKHNDLLSSRLRFPAEGHTPVPYVRSDGLSAVVYLSRSGQIHELTLVAGGWQTPQPVGDDWRTVRSRLGAGGLRPG